LPVGGDETVDGGWEKAGERTLRFALDAVYSLL